MATIQELMSTEGATFERNLLGLSEEQQAKSMMHMASQSTETAMINQVADEYKLTGKKRELLHAIRKVENGRQGREFGVLKPEAMRFENGDPVQSFLTQARWAAGTIDKRFTGDIDKFGARWAPIGAKNDPTGLNKNWVKNIKSHLNKEK